MGQFRNELEGAFRDAEAARLDGKWSVPEILRGFANVLDAAGTVLGQSVGTDEEFEELKEDVQWVFDTYFKPIDIPGIPEMWESLLESIASQYLGPVMDALRATYHKDDDD